MQQSVDCESLTPTPGATQQSVDCESLTPTQGATQQSVDCESLTPTQGATQQSVDCESLTPTRGATQQSVDCESLTPTQGATQQSVDCESLTPTRGATQQSVDSKIVPVSSIAPEGWGPKEGGNATSPLHSRVSPTKGTESEVKTYTRGHHDAPSISKYPPPLAQARPRSGKQRSQGIPVLSQARACARRATQRDTAHRKPARTPHQAHHSETWH